MDRSWIDLLFPQELLWGYSDLKDMDDADNTSVMSGGGGGASNSSAEMEGGMGGAINSSTEMEGGGMGGADNSSRMEGGGGNDETVPLYTFLCPFKYCRCQVVRGGRNGRCVFSVDERFLDRQCHCNRTGTVPQVVT